MALRQTPLYHRHDERGAGFTDFGGWEMPVEFSSIRSEHEAVRSDVGVFDVSHMGEVGLKGPDAGELCQRLLSSDVDIEPGDAQYSTLLLEDGTIFDDTILYRLSTEEYLLVPNAGKDGAVTDRFTHQRDENGLHVEVENQTTSWGMLAIQGPDAVETIPAAGHSLDHMEISAVEIAGVDCWCARTGYTGEDGFELLIPWEETAAVDATIDGTRCGLGARDTLRLEMGFVLAGNEFDQEDNRRTPFEARLDFVVDLNVEPHFVGRDALVRQREEGPRQLLCGLAMLDRGIPRSGYEITDGGGTEIGMVTSGTMSPTLGKPIALGYVDSGYAVEDEMVGVVVRGSEKMASIVTPPFLHSER